MGTKKSRNWTISIEEELMKEALAYIAGIVDGEGSIMIMRQASKAFMEQRAKRNCYHPHYHPCIRIGMQERAPLDFIVQHTGVGEVREEKPYQRKKPMFRYVIRSKVDVSRFLTLIMPYLLVKKQQAELALRFVNEWVSCNGTRISKEIQEKREQAWMQMRELNGVVQKSPSDLPKGKRGRDYSKEYVS